MQITDISYQDPDATTLIEAYTKARLAAPGESYMFRITYEGCGSFRLYDGTTGGESLSRQQLLIAISRLRGHAPDFCLQLTGEPAGESA